MASPGARKLGAAIDEEHRRPFAFYLDYSTEAVVRANGGTPPWDCIEVIEIRNMRNGKAEAVPMGPADDYEPHWQRLLDRVDRDWVDLRPNGITDRVLTVLLEFFDSGDPDRRIGRVRVSCGPFIELIGSPPAPGDETPG